jgi:CheY-like chemotaxis protein
MMDEIKIIVVEDDPEQQQIFRASVVVDEKKNNRKVNYEFAKTTDDAISRIDGTYDGAIIDLKLEDDDEGGDRVVQKMMESLFRVPVIFVTGHPTRVEESPLIINIRPRADGTYEDDLDCFFRIYRSGLTKIVGGRGRIEQGFHKVFLNNLLPDKQRNTWEMYGDEDPVRTEKALLRLTLNHLYMQLEDDGEECFAEEVYLFPPIQNGLKTGSIVKEKNGNKQFIILNPACDLVVRNGGQINTDKILLVAIDEESTVYGHILKKLDGQEERKEILRRFYANNRTLYHHWLPPTSFFPGGFINFRKLNTFNKRECRRNYDDPAVQISPHFIKDILSRFSTYYARQGQPEIECNKIIEDISQVE